MKRMSAILCLILLCGAALAAAATKKAAHPAAGMSLTGCLQKGDEPNTYLLTNVTGAAADRWELVGAPASLKMADHVGHKVEVHGSAVSGATAEKLEHEKGAKKDAKKETKEEKEKEKGEHHLRVHSLKHIAPTCP
jgi:hypothetical protein